jgi:hypothetical protein
MKCQGKTRHGKNCRYQAMIGKYCTIHWNVLDNERIRRKKKCKKPKENVI